MNSVIKPNPYNVKIIKPNKNMQQRVTNNTIKKIACKRCGKIKETQGLGDYCLACEQLMAYQKEREERDNENTADLNGESLISPNDMTDNEFMSWMTQTQRKPFTTVKLNI